MKTKMIASILALTAVALIATGCGSSDDDSGNSTRGNEVVVGNTNAADVAFVEHMVPHHENAVRMAEDLLENGQNPTLQKLAKDIIAAQNSEIDLMEEVAGQQSGEGTGSDDSMHQMDH